MSRQLGFNVDPNLPVKGADC